EGGDEVAPHAAQRTRLTSRFRLEIGTEATRLRRYDRSGWWDGVPRQGAPQQSYFANSIARDSRITVTLICPGYSRCSSISRAISWLSGAPASSSPSPGLTITRISRPACIA